MRGPCVTYEAVKRQLELLGHDVPDEAIRAYLADLQKGSSDEEPARPTSHPPAAEQPAPREPHTSRAAPGPRAKVQQLDDLCDKFEATLCQGGVAENVPGSTYRRDHANSCASRSNARGAGPLVSEEVMTRAQSILDDHHTGHTHSESRHYEAPASERLRKRPPHIRGTLQPRATTTHPDLDEPPANIAPEGFASRYTNAHSDAYYSRPSTAKPSRRHPQGPSHDSSAWLQAAARPRSRPATASEAAHNAWLEDDYEREYEYGDSADELHEYISQEPLPRGEERSTRMNAQVRRNAHPTSQRNATYIDSSDEDAYEDYRHLSGQGRDASRRQNPVNRKEEACMLNTDVVRGHARRSDVRQVMKDSARVKKTQARQAPRQRDMSPFDSNVEDHDREWENVLLEATGGVEVGSRAGQRRSGGGEAPYGAKRDDAWGLSDEWGDRATERSYSQVQHPHQQRPRTPLVANNSYIVGRSNLSGAARPIDRVARYQQLSKTWNRDRFLTKSKGQVLGYQEAFEHSHRREKVHLQHLKESNKAQRPATAGSAAGKFVPPGQKRRDKLRWNVRQRMQWQD